MRSQLLIGALLFSACAAPLQITGPYAARLSDSDVEQIKQVVSARPHIDHRLRKIEVVRPDRVRVEAGPTDASGGWSGTGFFVIQTKRSMAHR